MGLVKTIDAAGRTVTVRELTVTEVRDWVASLERLEEKVIDLVSALASDDMSLDELKRMSDLTDDDIGQLTATGIAALVSAAKALNPHFFNVRRRLLGVADPT